MPIAVIYIGSVMLLLGAAPFPYGYYILLRLVTTGIFVWAAIIAFERKEAVLPWIFILIAILFNPIIKIHFPKEIWAVIDIATGLLLLGTQSRIKSKEHSNADTV